MWLSKADDFARTILSTITREYPNQLWHPQDGPDDRPTPREIHPAFYGSFDWHSCVEMHWALVRLMRLAPPDALPLDEIRAVLNAHLTADGLGREADYLAGHPGFSRPYGQGWALALVHELQEWEDDPYAEHWAATAARLGETVAANLVEWLPKLTYPVRHGVHPNTAFGLSRALPYARSRPELGLLDAIGAAARRFFADDADYPAGWEPSGADFLSPALTEAELMAALLPGDEFAEWFDRFLPALPPALAKPPTVSDPTDGQLAHLAGLNFSRAMCAKRIARALPAGHPMAGDLRDAAAAHDEAGMPYATGGDYMTEHWLACYAIMSLSEE